MKRLVAALACFTLILPMGQAEDAKPAPAKAIRVPFETLASQHIVVKVKINGKGPYRLIFDTGAPVTLLNNRVAKAGGVFPKNFRRPFFALFGSMGDFKVKSLQVGAVEANNVPVVVMDHPTVEFVSKLVGPIDGIIGCSFWGRYRLSIDYQAKQMTFVPTSYRPPDLIKTVEKILLTGGGKAKTKVLAPAGQWGFRITKQAKDTEAGVTVAEVLAGSPAAAAGLKAGDRLLVLDGRWTDSVADCYAAAAHVSPGTAARVTIRREGKEREVTVHVQAGL
jgi:hypothetical protein